LPVILFGCLHGSFGPFLLVLGLSNKSPGIFGTNFRLPESVALIITVRNDLRQRLSRQSPLIGSSRGTRRGLFMVVTPHSVLIRAALGKRLV
jgi:hypothetical protein